jgi:hypothetical protein
MRHSTLKRVLTPALSLFIICAAVVGVASQADATVRPKAGQFCRRLGSHYGNLTCAAHRETVRVRVHHHWTTRTVTRKRWTAPAAAPAMPAATVVFVLPVIIVIVPVIVPVPVVVVTPKPAPKPAPAPVVMVRQWVTDVTATPYEATAHMEWDEPQWTPVTDRRECLDSVLSGEKVTLSGGFSGGVADPFWPQLTPIAQSRSVESYKVDSITDLGVTSGTGYYGGPLYCENSGGLVSWNGQVGGERFDHFQDVPEPYFHNSWKYTTLNSDGTTVQSSGHCDSSVDARTVPVPPTTYDHGTVTPFAPCG